eukprot:TRINITY_DN14414_c0_g1_i1.p1 TRINITY_DN14414_c0_g1~~TRINITY_DN14414_c0_g1_i1.p1  ORF type:complete len:244 (-),score=17.79 TRINITY_DN14414_c0_g1_i1:110-841(-)
MPVHVSFDHLRQRAITIHPFSGARDVRATEMDGTICEANFIEGALFIGADRNTGDYIAVTAVDDRVHVRVLGPTFRDVRTSVDLDTDVKPSGVALGPNGRVLFVWASFSTLCVDPFARTVTHLRARVDQAKTQNPFWHVVADERNCLVFACEQKLVTIDPVDGHQLAALPIKCRRVAISRDGVVAALILASGTPCNRYEVLFFATNTVKSSAIGHYKVPPARTQGLPRMAWADDCLWIWLAGL